jgi:hypothetical protein
MVIQPIELYWMGHRIGIIYDPHVDHFDIYGQWQPVQDLIYQQLLEAFTRDGEVSVLIGDIIPELHGTIQDITEDEIAVKIRQTEKRVGTRTF